MANRRTILCKLVAKQEGQYVQYVFQNLEEAENSFDRYINITQCPNWQLPAEIKKGMTGFLTFEPAEAGEVYTNHNGETDTYKYTGNYFINFVKDNLEDNNEKEFKF